MKHLLQFNRFMVMLIAMLTLSVTSAWGQTYTFTSKSWADANKGWTSDKDGYQYSSPNVQVTSAFSGAGATSKASFTNITKITISASTTSKGVGNITVKVGDGAAQTICSLNKPGSTAKSYSLEYATPVSGKVTFVVNCSTNSMYVQSITITTATKTDVTLDANEHGTADGAVTYTTGNATPDATPTWVSPASSDWTLTGYYTAATAGIKVINADNSLNTDATDYVDNGKWNYAESTLTLYAQWQSASNPQLTLSGTLEPFTYVAGQGPSEEQTIVLKGSNLTENVEVTAPEGYECRLEDETEYSSTLSLNADAVMEEDGVSIYVHLTEGLMAGTFNGKLTASSEGADDAEIAFQGSVTPAPLTSIAAFITAAPTEARELTFTAESNAVITGRTTKNIYVQDASGKGIMLFNNGGVPAWAVGNKIIGTIKGTYATYNSMPELVLTDYSKATAETAGSVTPVVLTEFTAANFADHACKLIKIEDVFFQSTSLSSNGVTVKNASETSFLVYNTFSLMSSKTLPAKTDAADVTGVYIAYGNSNPTYELAATAIDAGEAQINVDPIGGADEASAVGIAPGGSVTITPISGFTTKVDDVTKTAITTVPVTEPTSITIAASRDFYTDKSVTYFYKVNESIKAVNVTQPEVGGTIAADPTSAAAGTSVELSYEAASHYTFGAFTVMAGETPVTVNENEGAYSFTMPNSDVTVTATFTENAKGTATFAKGAEAATGEAPADIEWYVGENITLPANTFTYTGYKFTGWSDGTSTFAAGASYQMPEGGKAFTATWEQISKWAYTYTSNVEVGSDSVKIAGTNYAAKKTGTSKATGSTTITVPAGSSALHFHAAGWNNESVTLQVSMGATVLGSFDIPADAGMTGNGPVYTLANDPAATEYFMVALSNITEETTLTFTATSGKRFAIYGVNAVLPPAISVTPLSIDYGEWANPLWIQKYVRFTTNEFVQGQLSAEVVAGDKTYFNPGSFKGDSVSVLFFPQDITTTTPVSAKFVIKSYFQSQEEAVSDTVTLTAINLATGTPYIRLNRESIDFGTVDYGASVADQSVKVDFFNTTSVNVSISGEDAAAFSVDPTSLTQKGYVNVSAVTTLTAGTYNATLSVSATGATTKSIPLSVKILSQYSGDYSSNVEVGNDSVIIGGENFEAVKVGTSKAAGTAVINLPLGTERLNFHAAGWNDEDVTLVLLHGEDTLAVYPHLYADAGVKSSSPFTLEGNNYATAQYFYYDFATPLIEATDVTFTTSGTDYRFVLYGVNQEGGIVPVLDRIEIGGTATKTDYEVGDTFDPAGLTVSAIYTLGAEEQEPVVVTKDVEWSFNPATLTAGEYNVTATATYETKQDSKDVAVVVTAPTPTITVSKSAVGFGMVAKDAVVADQTVAVTLKAIASATIELTGDGASAFTVTPASLTEDGDITISANTANNGDFAATITISAAGAESKTIALSMIVGANPDVIVAGDLAATGNTYTDFSNVVKESGTKYAGMSAKDNDNNIQLRSKNSNSGIVSTSTVGYLKAVAFNVASGFNTIQVYGKNTAYAAASELYDNATKGTLLGTATATGTIILEDGITLSDYKYIGIRSYSGALYLANVSIAWTPATFYAVTLTQTDNGTIATSTDAAAEGETVTLIATPDADYAVASWTGLPEGATVSEDKKTVTFTMPAEAVTVSATFGQAYVRENTTIGNYGVVCLPMAVAAGDFQGAEVFKIVEKDADTNPKNLTIETVESMEAGRAYIILSNAENFTCMMTGTAVTTAVAAADNYGLAGTLTGTSFTGDGSQYVIVNNKVMKAGSVNVGANKAWIEMGSVPAAGQGAPQRVGSRRITLGSNESQVITGLDALFIQEGIQKMIVNGQLIIVKDGKMFNAQGQIVK